MIEQEEKPVDLGRTDEYDSGIIPNADVEVCLKVLRTMRAVAMGAHNPGYADMEAVVIFSRAHERIASLVELATAQDADASVVVTQTGGAK